MAEGIIGSFRFRPLSKYDLSSLADSTLYFSLPDDLNDPFDCQIDIEAALDRALVSTEGKRNKLLVEILRSRLAAMVQSDVSKWGVCCFSLNLINTQMWAHYADHHKGIALYYKIPESFISDATTNIVGWSVVDYGENPVTDFLVADLDEDLTPVDAAMKLVRRVLTVKAGGWAAEEEGRIVRKEPGLLKIPRDFLKQVCFGLKTSASDERLLRSIVEPNYPHVSFSRMILDPKTDTGMVAIDA